ncbi:MAG: hypothetical protein HWN68_15200 [Desulfobacterales bacterium]|nr:hypothetical protein [Desulfobacterales bacterium]
MAKKIPTLGIARNAWAMLIGFIVGVVVNRYIELKVPNFPGYGVPIVRGVNVDDAVLMAIGLAIMLFSRFVAKMRFAFYFGLGFFIAIVACELGEFIVEEVA